MPTKTVRVPAAEGAEGAETVERELHGLEGVVSASADPGSGRVRVEWTEAGTRWDAIRGFLESIGYPPAEEGGAEGGVRGGG